MLNCQSNSVDFRPHKSRVGNAFDPRVESDLNSSQYDNTGAKNNHGAYSGKGATMGTHTGSGFESGTGIGQSPSYSSNFNETRKSLLWIFSMPLPNLTQQFLDIMR